MNILWMYNILISHLPIQMVVLVRQVTPIQSILTNNQYHILFLNFLAYIWALFQELAVVKRHESQHCNGNGWTNLVACWLSSDLARDLSCWPLWFLFVAFPYNSPFVMFVIWKTYCPMSTKQTYLLTI